jgi:hypothetical protein
VGLTNQGLNLDPKSEGWANPHRSNGKEKGKITKNL